MTSRLIASALLTAVLVSVSFGGDPVGDYEGIELGVTKVTLYEIDSKGRLKKGGCGTLSAVEFEHEHPTGVVRAWAIMDNGLEKKGWIRKPKKKPQKDEKEMKKKKKCPKNSGKKCCCEDKKPKASKPSVVVFNGSASWTPVTNAPAARVTFNITNNYTCVRPAGAPSHCTCDLPIRYWSDYHYWCPTNLRWVRWR